MRFDTVVLKIKKIRSDGVDFEIQIGFETNSRVLSKIYPERKAKSDSKILALIRNSFRTGRSNPKNQILLWKFARTNEGFPHVRKLSD
ncbi:hypothetical protein CH380_11990 [Leptospira adleri]|uniref:Uncharacterized protein n=1 Tax=Leptospira adleri TaxID=2023186 RepID=A0A2M9YNK5_9LEPT|nr:hypothetical protein CH380_11990 [Leptospira adleri]PJZ62083.1 hypothetical protein CH376_09855 [Leptospira adleri]